MDLPAVILIALYGGSALSLVVELVLDAWRPPVPDDGGDWQDELAVS